MSVENLHRSKPDLYIEVASAISNDNYYLSLVAYYPNYRCPTSSEVAANGGNYRGYHFLTFLKNTDVQQNNLVRLAQVFESVQNARIATKIKNWIAFPSSSNAPMANEKLTMMEVDIPKSNFNLAPTESYQLNYLQQNCKADYDEMIILLEGHDRERAVLEKQLLEERQARLGDLYAQVKARVELEQKERDRKAAEAQMAAKERAQRSVANRTQNERFEMSKADALNRIATGMVNGSNSK